MSGLAALLAGHEPAGSYLWESNQPAPDVAHAVEVAGWRFGYVDGWTAAGRDDVLTRIASALHFPDYFGVNLDALVDCLRDVPERTVLLWDGWSVLARSDEAGFDGIVEVFRESAIAVLLRLSGPEHESGLDPQLPRLG